MVTKPTLGQPDWAPVLDAALDELENKKLNTTTATATFAVKLLNKPRQGAALPIAVPSGGLTWEAVPKGTYAAACSIGVDGAVYSRASSTEVLRSTDSLAVNFPAVLVNLNTLAGHTAGDQLVYATRTSAGYVAVTANGDSGKIWFTPNAAGTSGWSVVQSTRAIQLQAINKPRRGPDGKTLLLFGEYGTTANTTVRNLWLSRDGGATWATILQSRLIDTTINTHFHGADYDETRRRIWASAGDGPNAWFGYSDDFGVSWVDLPFTKMRGTLASTDQPSGNTYTQPVALTWLGERMIGTPDGQSTSGVWEFDRETGEPSVAFALPSGEQAFKQFGMTMSDGHNGREAYISFPDTGSGSLKTYHVGSGDFGRSWWLLATTTHTATPGVVPVIGPDPAGYLFWKPINAFSGNLVRARTPLWTWRTPE
jgi:hypothetical protein